MFIEDFYSSNIFLRNEKARQEWKKVAAISIFNKDSYLE